MSLARNELECLEHISKVLGKQITEENRGNFHIDLRGWKSCLDIYDVDTYHNIAQILGVTELESFGGVHYGLEVPTKNGRSDRWLVGLGGRRDSEFLEKYEKFYKLTE